MPDPVCVQDHRGKRFGYAILYLILGLDVKDLDFWPMIWPLVAGDLMQMYSKLLSPPRIYS